MKSINQSSVFLKIAFRYIWRNKKYSALNFFGLHLDSFARSLRSCMALIVQL